MLPEANVVRGTGGGDALRLSTRVQTPGRPAIRTRVRFRRPSPPRERQPDQPDTINPKN